jgi:hypothetical protein
MNDTTNSIKLTQMSSLIIGRMWLNGDQDLVQSLVLTQETLIEPGARFNTGNKSIVISNSLPTKLLLKAGTSLNFFKNNLPKREGKVDPDYTVSVMLEAGEAAALIAQERAIRAEKAEKVAVV